MAMLRWSRAECCSDEHILEEIACFGIGKLLLEEFEC